MASTLIESGQADRMESLIASREKFLSFLSARLHDKAAAEDVLQAAYIKALEHGSDICDDESTVAWFYRILRNALIDHSRRTSIRDKADATYAADIPLTYEAELEQTACACMGDVNGTGSFVMKTERVGADTLLAQIVKMVSEAQRNRHRCSDGDGWYNAYQG